MCRVGLSNRGARCTWIAERREIDELIDDNRKGMQRVTTGLKRKRKSNLWENIIKPDELWIIDSMERNFFGKGIGLSPRNLRGKGQASLNRNLHFWCVNLTWWFLTRVQRADFMV